MRLCNTHRAFRQLCTRDRTLSIQKYWAAHLKTRQHAQTTAHTAEKAEAHAHILKLLQRRQRKGYLTAHSCVVQLQHAKIRQFAELRRRLTVDQREGKHQLHTDTVKTRQHTQQR